MSDQTPCVVDDGGQCQAFFPGHNTHCIHAKHLGRTPWGWRDAVVRTVDGRTLTVAYVEGGHEVQLWHHDDLTAEVAVGEPVRLHEQYHALGGPFGWLNVALHDGLGPVPEPADRRAWEDAMTGGVQDLSTGRALALDWLHPRGR